jgi:diacylglycerol kinase (ATP)
VRVLIVANPAADGVSEDLVDEVAAHCGDRVDGVDVDWSEPRDSSPVASLMGLLETPRSLVVAVGGDGTVRTAAEAIARTRGAWPDGGRDAGAPVLAVVPSGGGGNSVYAALWGDRPWSEALDGAIDGVDGARAFDLIRVEDVDDASVLGVNTGLIAEVAEAVERAREEDPDAPREEQYGKALLDAMQTFEPFPVSVRVDGVAIHEGDATFVSIGGARAFGGGNLPLLPRAELDDGLLDVCAVPGPTSPEAFAEAAASVAIGEHVNRPDVAYRQGRRVEIERTDGRPLAIEHDGESQPGRPALHLAVVARAVPAVLPPAR